MEIMTHFPAWNSQHAQYSNFFQKFARRDSLCTVAKFQRNDPYAGGNGGHRPFAFGAPRGSREMTGPLRLVIVEDDALIAMDLADLLIGMGHEVCAIASTEGDAVEAATRCRPDLMIVDGTLGAGSGVAAMRRILEHGFIAHFYVTGNPWQVLSQAKDAVVLNKPFTRLDLNRGIAEARAAGRGRLNPG